MSAPPSKPSSCILEIVLSLIVSFTRHCSLLRSSPWTCSLPHKIVRVLPLFSSKYNSSLFFPFLFSSFHIWRPFLESSYPTLVLSHCLPFQKISTFLHFQYDRLLLPYYKDSIIRRSPLPFLCKVNCSSSVWTGQDMDRVPLFSLRTVDPFASSLAS